MAFGKTGVLYQHTPLRDVINARLREQKITAYHLAQHLQGKVPQRTLYNFLDGGEIKARYLDHILEALYLFVVPRNGMGGRGGKEWVKRDWDRQRADSLGLNRYYSPHLDGTSSAFKEAVARDALRQRPTQ